MAIVGIYKITSPSGKVYIGQSVDISARWGCHRRMHGRSKLNNSFKKYGAITHLFEIVHELPYDVSAETLVAYEQLYMDLYRACGVELLNLKEAGSRGKVSEETRQRMKVSKVGINKGSKHTFEHRRKNSEAKKGDKCYMYGIESSKHPQAKRIIDTSTGKKYGTVKEAATALGIKRTTLSMRLIGKNKNKTTLAYDIE